MERKTRTQLIIGIGFMIAAVLIVIAGYGLVSSQFGPDSGRNGANGQGDGSQTIYQIWATSRQLERGTQLTDQDIKVLKVAGESPLGAVPTTRPVRGRYLREDVKPGQILLESLMADTPHEVGLAALVPNGMRAIAVRVSDEIAVGNFIRPGDFVDIQYVLKETALAPSRRVSQTQLAENPAGGEDRSEARILIQNIEVLSIGPLIKGDQATNVDPYRNVTLALMPEQASRFALARDMGSYFLSLRGLQDHDEAEDKTIIVDDLRGEDAKERVKRRQEEAAAEHGNQKRVAPPQKVRVLGGRSTVGGRR